MDNRPQTARHPLILSLMIGMALLTACSGKQLTTSGEEQPAPAPVAAEPAPVAPAPAPEPTPVAVEPAPIVPEPVPAPVAPEPAPVIVQPEPIAVAKPVQPEPAPAPQPVAAPEPVASLEDIYFDFDKFTLRSDARSVLEKNAQLLKKDPSRKITIEGHCDERGSSAYNMVLGDRRAQSTKKYLTDLGVSAKQLRTTSYGKERLSCSSQTEECHQANRRAHFQAP